MVGCSDSREGCLGKIISPTGWQTRCVNAIQSQPTNIACRLCQEITPHLKLFHLGIKRSTSKIEEAAIQWVVHASNKRCLVGT